MRAIIFDMALATMILSAGCAGKSVRFAGEFQRILATQAAAWNRGDIDAFVEPYWHSPQLTFSSGGQVTRGWEETKRRYHLRYPTHVSMGLLAFSDLEVTSLGPRAALVIGRWHLQRKEPIGGTFSLVFRRINRRWVIVHDHTSLDDS